MSNFTQVVTLPSRGLLNPEIPNGEITQRCMMVGDQKYLSGSNQDANTALRNLIQRTTESPEDFDVDNLTLSDTLYLLFKLRILSYGNIYTFKTKCPECGKKISVTLDLSELPVDILEEDFRDHLVGKLPQRGDEVYTKVLKNKDLDEIAKEVRRRKRKNPEDTSEYILRIVYSIEKIRVMSQKVELTNVIDIEKYVSSLTDYDAQSILALRDSANFGVAPVIDYICPECKQEIEVSLRFSGDFFRPNFSR